MVGHIIRGVKEANQKRHGRMKCEKQLEEETKLRINVTYSRLKKMKGNMEKTHQLDQPVYTPKGEEA